MPEPHASPANVLVEVRDLEKSFVMERRVIPVLRGIDLDIGARDLLSITGASGAGKSTFLHVVGTLEGATRGKLTFDGVVLSKMNEAALARFRNENIGFVFQFHHLLTEFTALENVMMPAFINRLPEPEARARAEELLVALGLGERLRHRPAELSGGEQQRVAIARALVMKPRLLLADEPTGNLDAGTAAAIHDLLVESNERFGTAIVVVTHNEELARRMPRRLRMKDGRLQQVDGR
ncbi:MAG: ABC transporter ATP-binding protein [Deltaproteobacteria bacterium]|nr:ABC transporter ATP-binding protein [Deltaproteobacteria bacterium]